MTRHSQWIVAGALALAILTPAAAEEEMYLLSKTPEYAVGDKSESREVALQKRRVTNDETGDALDVGSKRMTVERVDEVLEVDSSGKVQAFRTTIRSAAMAADRTAPEAKAFEAEVQIRKIHFVARRKGLKFAADTTTIVSEAHESLRASQVSLLKEIAEEDMSLAGYPEADVLLLPAEPVPVGHVWKPSREVLDKWTAANPAAQKVGGKAQDAEFKLVSVRDGVARVQGTVTVTGVIQGKTIRFGANVVANIDTATGRWVSKNSSGDIRVPLGGVTAVFHMEDQASAEYAAGDGTASALPEGVHKLGWKPAGPDENSFRYAAAGFSMDVPKEWQSAKGGEGGRVAEFSGHGNNASVVVNVNDLGRPMDIEDMLPSFLKAMRENVPDFALKGTERVSLPGQVPGVLMAADSHGGKLRLLILLVFHDERVLQFTGGAPLEQEAMIAEVLGMLRSARVFDPDVTGAPE
jgi:hypothetical protein